MICMRQHEALNRLYSKHKNVLMNKFMIQMQANGDRRWTSSAYAMQSLAAIKIWMEKKRFSRWHQVHRLDIDMPYAANFSPFISLSLPFPRPFSNSRSPIQSSIYGDYSVDISCGIIPSAPTAIARNTWVVCVLLILYFSPHSYRCWDILIFIKLQCISCLDKLIAPAHLHQSTE